MKLVVATGNPGKARELHALLGHQFDLVIQSELGVESVEETGSTFEENALLKARHAAAATGLPAVADDSGLEVEALDGAPGVRSARFAGEGASDGENMALLLERLEKVPPGARGANFRCVIALVRHAEDEQPVIATGRWSGSITQGPRGQGGFGYDPVFQPADSSLTAAEMEASQKRAQSHRGKAVAELARQLVARNL